MELVLFLFKLVHVFNLDKDSFVNDILEVFNINVEHSVGKFSKVIGKTACCWHSKNVVAVISSEGRFLLLNFANPHNVTVQMDVNFLK